MPVSQNLKRSIDIFHCKDIFHRQSISWGRVLASDSLYSPFPFTLNLAIMLEIVYSFITYLALSSTSNAVRSETVRPFWLAANFSLKTVCQLDSGTFDVSLSHRKFTRLEFYLYLSELSKFHKECSKIFLSRNRRMQSHD